MTSTQVCLHLGYFYGLKLLRAVGSTRIASPVLLHSFLLLPQDIVARVQRGADCKSIEVFTPTA